MNIEYRVNEKISTEQFVDLLERSNLAERRPIDDAECIAGMLSNSNLLVTAWHDETLVGVSRCVTDFHYCCYLSDIAVDERYQRNGIGKKLQIKTQSKLGPKCKLLLVAAPAANDYYGQIGYTNNSRCWILNRDESII